MSSADPEKTDEVRDEEKLADRADAEQYEDAGSVVNVYTTAEKALVRRLDLRILPIACLMYLVACELCHSRLRCDTSSRAK